MPTHTQYRRKFTCGWVQRLKQQICQIKKLRPKETSKNRILLSHSINVTTEQKWVRPKKIEEGWGELYSMASEDRCRRWPALPHAETKKYRLYLSCPTLRGGPTGTRNHLLFGYNTCSSTTDITSDLQQTRSIII